jgi:hypothetical protein
MIIGTIFISGHSIFFQWAWSLFREELGLHEPYSANISFCGALHLGLLFQTTKTIIFMSKIISARITDETPEVSDTSGVFLTGSKTDPKDEVTVEPYGTLAGKDHTVIVLQVTHGNETPATDQLDGDNMTLKASGTGNTSYLSLILEGNDPNNWDINVNTSGKSVYTFSKGRGGGGHH